MRRRLLRDGPLGNHVVPVSVAVSSSVSVGVSIGVVLVGVSRHRRERQCGHGLLFAGRPL